MKKCNTCKIIKELIEFGKDAQNKNGIKSCCKYCNNIATKNYKKTEDGVISQIYSDQKGNSKKREHELPTYTKEQLKTWLYKNNFKELFNTWVTSGHKTKLRPSVDRLNDYKSYTMDNIQLVTWKENEEKGNNDRKSGINNKKSKIVFKYSKENVFIKEYYSMSEAGRRTGVSVVSICNCCKGKHKTAGGFMWKYADSSEK